MNWIEKLEFAGDSVLALATSFVLGGLIGIERQYRQRTAGLRTNVLVAIGACQFVNTAIMIAGSEGGARVISYVVSGIGFLGAGAIMKEGANVTGLNTAATLWCSAGVGACCGAGLELQGLLLTIFALLGNTALRPLVNAVDRIPVNSRSAEVSYELMVTVPPAEASHAHRHVVETLQNARYPVRQVRISHSSSNSVTTVVATLYSTSLDPLEMDAVLDKLKELDCVLDAAWMSSVVE